MQKTGSQQRNHKKTDGFFDFLKLSEVDVGVSKNKGTPKWMVKIMESPIKIDDLGGKPPIFLATPMCFSWTRIKHQPHGLSKALMDFYQVKDLEEVFLGVLVFMDVP